MKIKRIAGGVILGALLILGLFNQWKYNFAYLFKNRRAVFNMLSLTDEERHQRSLGEIFGVVEKIKSLPENAVLYFVPVFADTLGAKQNRLWWWHLNHILRYFCYPRKILILHFDLYHNSRLEYMQKFMQGKKRFSELDWIKSREITHLILYRNNAVSIVPVSTPIDF